MERPQVLPGPAGIYAGEIEALFRSSRRRAGLFAALAILAVVAGQGPARAADPPLTGTTFAIGFSSLTGPNESPYTGGFEGSFLLNPTAGKWFQGFEYGSPVPSIYVGGREAPQNSVLQVTTGTYRFSFSSLDFSSNNGESDYTIQGFLGATLQFQQSGTLAASFPPTFGFKKLTSAFESAEIDGLYIQLTPGQGTTSINLDNIKLVVVPEPGALTLALGGLAALACLRRRR